MSEENIPSENSKKEIINSKQEEVTKNISQQVTSAIFTFKKEHL